MKYRELPGNTKKYHNGSQELHSRAVIMVHERGCGCTDCCLGHRVNSGIASSSKTLRPTIGFSTHSHALTQPLIRLPYHFCLSVQTCILHWHTLFPPLHIDSLLHSCILIYLFHFFSDPRAGSCTQSFALASSLSMHPVSSPTHWCTLSVSPLLSLSTASK